MYSKKQECSSCELHSCFSASLMLFAMLALQPGERDLSLLAWSDYRRRLGAF